MEQPETIEREKRGADSVQRPCSATYDFKKNIKRLKDAAGLLTRYKSDGVTEYHRDLISEVMVNIDKVIKAEYDARKTYGRSKRTQTLGA